MKKLHAVLALICAAALTGATASSATPSGTTTNTTSKSYVASTAVIANPERGFYHHTETHFRADGTGYEPLDRAELRTWREQEHITQILRVFYFEKFATQDRLDKAYLDLVRQDFATIRAAGVKAIVRFAYAQPKDDWPYQPPYGDAPKSRVLKHIAQLRPILRANADVIATVQSGFIGLWGEGYYTDYFAADPTDPGTLTDQDWANRRDVFLALLHALPPNRTVQLRTMLMKQKATGRPTGIAGALTEEEAFTGTAAARLGHHNDCFLASPDDFGTFLSDPITLDQEYLAQDSKFVPMGGETCTVNPPRSEWPSAEAEMARYHYSYLNTDYNQDVLDSWGDHIVDAQRRLGYRFRLTEGRFTDGVRPGRSFKVDLSVHNDGFATPYNPRDVSLILRGAHRSYAVPVHADPRRWDAGATTDLAIRACAAVPPGRYQLLLDLPAPERRLRSQAAYAIQLANEGVWDSDTGANELGHTLVVGRDQPKTARCHHAQLPRPLPR